MKKSYSEIDSNDKNKIINTYYSLKDKSFKEMSDIANVSNRCFSRVLKESGINTKLKNRYTLNHEYFSIINYEKVLTYWDFCMQMDALEETMI